MSSQSEVGRQQGNALSFASSSSVLAAEGLGCRRGHGPEARSDEWPSMEGTSSTVACWLESKLGTGGLARASVLAAHQMGHRTFARGRPPAGHFNSRAEELHSCKELACDNAAGSVAPWPVQQNAQQSSVAASLASLCITPPEHSKRPGAHVGRFRARCLALHGLFCPCFVSARPQPRPAACCWCSLGTLAP